MRKLSLEIRRGEESEGLRHKNWEQDTGETWEPTMPSGTSHTLTLPTGQRGSKPRNCHPGQNAAPLLTCAVIPNDGHHDDIQQEPGTKISTYRAVLTASEAGRTHRFISEETETQRTEGTHLGSFASGAVKKQALVVPYQGSCLELLCWFPQSLSS